MTPDFRDGSRTHRFRGPHHGVHIRQWGDGPALITIECDPTYVGIGAAIFPTEARHLAQALLRAADAADGVRRSGREEDMPAGR